MTRHWEIDIETEPDVVLDVSGDALVAFDEALRHDERVIGPSTSQGSGALGASFHVLASTPSAAATAAEDAFRGALRAIVPAAAGPAMALSDEPWPTITLLSVVAEVDEAAA